MAERLPVWSYGSRAVRRQREQQSLAQLGTQVGPLVAAGDPASLARARALTNVEQRAERAAQYRAQLQARMRAAAGIPSDRETMGVAPAKKKGGGLLGKVGNALGDAAGEVADRAGDALGAVKDVAGDVAGGTPEIAKRGVTHGLTALDAPRKYVGGPAFATLTGATKADRKPILDANGNPTGKYYRAAPNFGDMAHSLASALTSNPVDTYQAGLKANEERLADPKMGTFARVLESGVQDPLTWLGPGALGKAAKFVPEAAKASKGFKVAEALLEQPKAVGLGGVVGAAAGAQGAEDAGLGPTGQTIASLAGGAVGGMAGAGVAGTLQAGRAQAAREAAAGRGVNVGRVLADELGSTPEGGKPDVRVLGERGKGRVVAFDHALGADVQPGQVVDTPYGRVTLVGLEDTGTGGQQWRGKFVASSKKHGTLKSDSVLIRQPASEATPGGAASAPAAQVAQGTPEMGTPFPTTRLAGAEPAAANVDVASAGYNTGAATRGAGLLTAEGEDILAAADAGKIAPLMTNNLRRIGRENDLFITGATTPEELIAGLRAKRGAPRGAMAVAGAGEPPIQPPDAPGAPVPNPDEFTNANPDRVQADMSGLGGATPEEPPDFAAMSKAAFDAEHAAEAAKASDKLLRLGINSADLPLNLPEFQPGLRRVDRYMNALKDQLGLVKYKEDPLATPAMRARGKLLPVVDSQAARFGTTWDARAKEVFSRDAQGRIADLPGAPTIQDLAADIPKYEAFLTPAQTKFLDELRFETGKYYDLIREAGIDLSTYRPDVQPDGRSFYLPRGTASTLDIETAPPRYTGGSIPKTGRKAGFEKEASFPSMAGPEGGIEAGYKYSDFGAALQGYARDAGRRAVDQYTSEYFKSLRYESGQQIGMTYADRIDEPLRAAYQAKVKDLTSIRNRLATAERRAGIAAKESDELDSALMAFSDAADAAPDLQPLSREFVRQRRKAQKLRNPRRVVQYDPVSGTANQLQEDFLRADTIDRVVTAFEDQFPDSLEYANEVDQAIANTARRISELETRGLRYGQQAQLLGRQLERTKGDLEKLAPEYRQAVATARKGDRTSMSINFAPLNGRQFPIELANAANRYLDAANPTRGRAAVTIHATEAFNSLLRGLRATGDLSFLGIQGLLGAVRDPVGYAKAMSVAYRGMAQPEVLGKYLADFDATRAAVGKPTTRDWASMGLHIGGSELSEFAIQAKGLPGIAKRVGEVPVGKQLAGVAKASNRAFGYFGDTMRAELADTMYDAAVKSGRTLDDAGMREIANSANLMTGWSPNTFGGTVGQLALFAPRFFQSQLEMIGNLAKFGSIEGSEARKAMVRLLGVSAGMTVLANELSPEGLKPEEYLSPFRDPKDPRSGFNPNFMRFRVGGADTTILGPWDSLLRGLVTTAGGLANELPGVSAKGDATSLLRTKASPALSTAWDLFSGENAIGEHASLKDPEYIMRSIVPLSVSDIGPQSFTKGGALSQVVGFSGMKASPLSPSEQLDALARARFSKGWGELEPAEKAKLKEEHPDVWQRSVDVKDAKSQQYYDMQSQSRTQQEADNALMLSGQLDVNAWKAAASDRRTKLAGARDALLGQFEGSGGNKVLNAYYAAIDAAQVNGRIDWDKVDAYTAGLSEADQKVIERNAGASRTPLERAYSAIANEYYSLPKYRGLNSDQARAVDNLLSAVSSLSGSKAGQSRTQSRLAKSRVLAKAAEMVGADEETVKLARRAIYGLLVETPDRTKWKAKHPEGALISGGLMTPEAVAAVETRVKGLALAA